jgi:SAM-dependent methyltransferase
VLFESHDEAKFFRFALRLGFTNFVRNGFRLGLKKTVGKITQPINSYTRFAEYRQMEAAIHPWISSNADKTPVILDLGSPKPFGLYLAYNYEVSVHLTDISRANIDEYRTMWKPWEARAKGRVLFLRLDGRNLPYADDAFDIVYSMSVVEHIEGPCGDTRAVAEMWRVLRPGGILAISVPFGLTYIEQAIRGIRGAAERVRDKKLYFFQRIYDLPNLRKRLLEPLLPAASEIVCFTLTRARPQLHRVWGKLPDNARGLLGWVNPVLSLLLNRVKAGLHPCPSGAYSEVHKASDLYCDALVAAVKNGGPCKPRGQSAIWRPVAILD